MIQVRNTVLEEKEKKFSFYLKIALMDLNKILFYILNIYYV